MLSFVSTGSARVCVSSAEKKNEEEREHLAYVQTKKGDIEKDGKLA